MGNRAYLGGLNLIGLKRRAFDRENLHNLRRAYRLLFAEEGTMAERVEDVAKEYADDENVMLIINFIRAHSDRGLCVPQ